MGKSNVVALEEIRAVKRQTHVRQHLEQRFTEWLEKLEVEMTSASPTLAQLTEAVFKLRQELTGAVVEGLVDQYYASEQEWQASACPDCGQRFQARQEEGRTVETMSGAVTVSRPYFYCVRCQQGFYPFDQVLGLQDEQKQRDVQQAVVTLTKEVPYETGCEVFEELTGMSISVHTAHELTNTVAEGLIVLDVSPSRKEIARRVQEVATGKKWRPILVLSVDGAAVPTRPASVAGRRKVRAKRARWQGEWRKAKGFRVHLVDEERIVHLISWHQIQDEEGLFEALRQIKEAGLIPEEAVRLCVLADGARWIWKRLSPLVPTAQEILDDDHCSEPIHRVAQAHCADAPHKALEWVDATRAQLFCNAVAGVIWGLQRMKPRNDEAEKESDNGIRDLDYT